MLRTALMAGRDKNCSLRYQLFVRLETSMESRLLTFVKTSEFFLELGHIFFELDPFLLFSVVFCIRLQVDHRHFLVFAVEFVKLDDRVRLTLWVGGVVAELISFTVLLHTDLVTLLSLAKVESFATIYTC